MCERERGRGKGKERRGEERESVVGSSGAVVTGGYEPVLGVLGIELGSSERAIVIYLQHQLMHIHLIFVVLRIDARPLYIEENILLLSYIPIPIFFFLVTLHMYTKLS